MTLADLCDDPGFGQEQGVTMPLILQAGVHASISMEHYRSQCCPGPTVSGTDLVRVHNKCPFWSWSYWSGNDAAIVEEPTPEMRFGSATHAYIVEGPAALAERYAIKPDGLSLNSNAGKAWKEANADRERLDADDLETIIAMDRVVKAHPLAGRLLTKGDPEVTAVWQEPETGIWLRTRPDRLLLANKMAINYKTAANGTYEKWRRDAFDLGYHLSAALSVDVFAALGHALKYVHVVQEKKPPYIVTVRELDQGFIEHGRIAYQRALRLFAEGLNTGKFAQYADGVEEVSLPAWAAKLEFAA